MKTLYHIGIDPGVNNGWACWDSDAEEFTELETFMFWDLVGRIMLMSYKTQAGKERPGIQFYLEDPRKIRPNWRRGRGASRAADDKISQNIGSVKRTAELIQELLDKHNFDYILVPPTTASKWTAETFKQYTGYAERTNEHERDAARLVFQR